MQALVLLNDPTYVEAARKFAERIMLHASQDQARVAYAFEIALSRPPQTEEIIYVHIRVSLSKRRVLHRVCQRIARIVFWHVCVYRVVSKRRFRQIWVHSPNGCASDSDNCQSGNSVVFEHRQARETKS